MQVDLRSRDAAYTLLHDNDLEMNTQVRDYLQKIANARVTVPTNNPLVEVSYCDCDDTHGDLEIEEVITLREYLAKIYGNEYGKISIDRSYGPGCWSVDSNIEDWEVDWVYDTVFQRPTEYGYWNLENMYEDFDFVKEVDQFMAEHGTFDPENDKLPTKKDIQTFFNK